MNLTPKQLRIIAFSAAAARFNQPAWFKVLQYIQQNRSWQQEMKYGVEEEEFRARSLDDRSRGRYRDSYPRPSTALMTRLLMELIPESLRLVLWHALRERYEGQDDSGSEPAPDPLVAPTN